jgi:poly(A) polymerase
VIPTSANPILEEAAPLAEIFRAAGFRLYLVGGIVRDMLLGRLTHRVDLDFTTDAEPSQIKALLAPWATSLWTQGERFGTIGATRGGRTYEITTHRGERYEAEDRHPEVQFSTSLEEDLIRRDFTVNALAIEVTAAHPTLIDPFGGSEDLAALVLRTPGTAQDSFSDDPLRMLRAARFIAGYQLVPTTELTQAAEQLAQRLEIVSVERIREEFDKLMVTQDPSAGLWFLHDTGLAQFFFPELSALRVEQDPIHQHKDVLTHTIAVVAKTQPNLVLRLAAMYHDVGKPKTRAVGDSGVSFHHHEVVGARMTRQRMKALRYSNDMVERVSQLVFLHLRFHTYSMGWTDSAVRRFVRDAGDQLEELIELTRCDCTTRNRRKAEILSKRMDDLEERIATLAAQEELAAIRPDLDGREVAEHLGIQPSREVGDALRHLLELRLDRGPMAKEDALKELDLWWAERQQG